MGERNVNLFLLTDLMLLVVFVGLILKVFDLSGMLLIAELIFLVLILLVSIVSLIGVYYHARIGWVLLALIFLLVLLDIVFIYKKTGFTGTSFYLTLFISAVGFVISTANIKKGVVVEEEITRDEDVVTTYTPGKFVGSKTGHSYHIPKCDWAKRIKKKRQVWFDSKEEAKKEKYKPHSCVE